MPRYRVQWHTEDIGEWFDGGANFGVGPIDTLEKARAALGVEMRATASLWFPEGDLRVTVAAAPARLAGVGQVLIIHRPGSVDPDAGVRHRIIEEEGS